MLTVRLLGTIGNLAFIATIGLLIFSIFAGPQTVEGDPDGLIVSMTMPGYRGWVWTLSGISFGVGVLSAVLSGLCAAVVSWEYQISKD
ncbi:hypothetical protein AB6T38_16440 [Aliiglaciecola sp. SL4]|uniref:hypothetical protein n=1 Tax=Aliiglaciecola sp. SL4 TaxID=3239806 RepID=UPI00355BD422